MFLALTTCCAHDRRCLLTASRWLRYDFSILGLFVATKEITFMPKRAHKKATSFDWTQKLDAEAVEAAMEEATVDANGEDEQHSGLLTVIGEELQFPFSAQVLGETVTIVDMEWPEHDGFGLDLIVERDGERHRMEARSVELLEPLPAGHLFLAAYLAWKKHV